MARELSLDDARAYLLNEGVPLKTVEVFIGHFLDNREIWRQFERFALDAISLNRRIGAKAIMERVRWEVEIEKGEEWKVNDHYTAYYSRIFMVKHPEYRGYFETRKVKGLESV